ncbi:hypothetical protein [Roseospira navarrensis]|uniref:Uncharacterized protein n=1 Tax=Roseospira navarrensis TaxID=140058 RepID=A0A7X1ZDH0_9PROT|nr:hypothetical protein [Roseospira navarrensis]MQX35521.1 hypothetical protein [Roseospira navarrensis]
MNRFAITPQELLTAAAVFAAVMIGFVVLSQETGWPNAASGWPLALIVAAVLAAASPALRVLGELQASRASVTLPGGIAFDFSGTVVETRPDPVPPNIVDPGLMLQDTSQEELDRAAARLAEATFVVADLEDGRAWYRSRLFALAGTAHVLGAPKAIVLLGTLGGEPRQPGGWIAPGDLVTALRRSDARYDALWTHARAYLSQVQTPQPAGQAPYPRLMEYQSHHMQIGDRVMMRILVNQMQMPDAGAGFSLIEDVEAPDWIDLRQAEALMAPWLVRKQIDLETDTRAQAAALATIEQPYVLAMRDGRYAGMIDVAGAQRRMLKALVTAAEG